MGGLRKFMPVTALAFTIAWLAIAGIPPLSGFWAKDEIICRRVLRPRLRASGRRRSVAALPHRALHDPRDAARLLRQRAVPRRRVGADPRRGRPAADDADAGDRAARSTAATCTSTRSHRVARPSTTARRRRRADAGRSARDAVDHGGRRRSCSRSSPSSVGFSTCRSRTRVPDRLARPGVRGGRPSRSPTRFWSGVRRSTSSR